MSNEKLEEAVDVVRTVMHGWNHYGKLADHARALRGHVNYADEQVKYFEKRQEEEWQRVRPALRKLMDG